jgi:hypothetical protein
MADLQLAVKMRQLDREAQAELYSLQRERDTQLQMEIIRSEDSSDNQRVVEMTKLDRATLEQANMIRKLSKRDAITKTLQLLAENPNTSPSVIAEQIGRSRQTVYDYLKEPNSSE